MAKFRKNRGIKEFNAYLNSPSQYLYCKNFKIRSFWDFSMSTVIIGVNIFLYLKIYK